MSDNRKGKRHFMEGKDGKNKGQKKMPRIDREDEDRFDWKSAVNRLEREE